jgi:hypothetical protein
MKYITKNTRVQGNGYSYNLNNKYDATKLCEKLNNYENKINELQKQLTTQDKYKELQKHIIALQMDLTNVQADLNRIKEMMQ